MDGAINGCSNLAEMCAIPEDDLEWGECQALAKGWRVLACMVAPQEISTADWAQTQQDDPELLEVIWLYQKEHLATIKINTYELVSLETILCHWLKLKLCEGVLYLKTEPHRNG